LRYQKKSQRLWSDLKYALKAAFGVFKPENCIDFTGFTSAAQRDGLKWC
jgi:hypothetical protein